MQEHFEVTEHTHLDTLERQTTTVGHRNISAIVFQKHVRDYKAERNFLFCFGHHTESCVNQKLLIIRVWPVEIWGGCGSAGALSSPNVLGQCFALLVGFPLCGVFTVPSSQTHHPHCKLCHEDILCRRP